MRDHRLAFTRMSKGRGCGVADAVSAKGATLWGVVYEISDVDIGRLDASEGYRLGRNTNSYWRRQCTVFAEDNVERPVAVFAYFAEPQPNPPRPNAVYKQLIVSGAAHWHLPGSYVADLQRIEVDE
jgi:hypothetical protein